MQRMQSILPIRCKFRCPFKQAFLLISFKRCQGSRSRHRVARISITVEKFNHFLRARHKCIMNFILHDHRTHRYHAIGQTFGSGDNVRRHAIIVRGKITTHAAKTSNHFIKYQQNTMLGTYIAQPLQIPLWRYQHPGRASHRLYNHRRNGRCIMQSHNTLKLISQVRPMLRLTFYKIIQFWQMGVRHMVNAG